MARQFSGNQDFYPSRGGGTLGADRKAATALVFQDVVAGILSTVAIQGDDGTLIAIQASALLTDNVIFNATTVFVAALGGGKIYVEEADYTLAATWNVSVDIFVQGAAWDVVLNYDAGGNCITVTGDNVKIRDLKIIIVAGAGGAGTRPNGILADTRTNLEVFGVWVIGDTSVADDGSNLRQCGIVFDTVTESRIINNRFEDNDRFGIILDTSEDNIIIGDICEGNSLAGIALISNSNHNTISENGCQGNVQGGISLNNSDENIVNNNLCQGNTTPGIVLGNFSVDNTVSSNLCQGNTTSGILLAFGNNNAVIGNTCQGNTQHGIQLDDSTDNTVVGNSCNENDSGNTGSFDGINITDVSLDNLVHSNTCNDNDRFGINIDDVRALRNWVKNNQLRGNTSGPFNDDIANLTKLATREIQLIQGTTFISTAGEAWGWEIDAGAEFALGIGWLPLELQQVVRIRVIGVGLAAPGVGNQMRIELTGEGATFDEIFSTNSIDVANKNSEEINFAIDDVIQWVFTVTDDAQIGTLAGGDRLQIKLLHEAAGNGDIATDAILDTVQVEYV